MKMKYVWKLADKVYEMGYEDATGHALVDIQDVRAVDKIFKSQQEKKDFQVHSLDHKRYKEIVELCIKIREKTID